MSYQRFKNPKSQIAAPATVCDTSSRNMGSVASVANAKNSVATVFDAQAVDIAYISKTVASVASVAGSNSHISLARTPPTAKINNNNIYNKGLHHSEPVSLPEKAAELPPPPPICVSTPATVATVPAYRAALAKFKDHRPYGVTRFRHDQAVWAAEMFIDEWETMAAEFGWSADDIFARDGLAWWLAVDIVTALGPEHAVTESRRIYDRDTQGLAKSIRGARQCIA